MNQLPLHQATPGVTERTRVVLASIMPPDFSTRFSALGIESLAGYARSQMGSSCEIKLIDSQLCSSRTSLIQEILDFDPQIVGFSVHPGAKPEVSEIIYQMKKKGHAPLFIFGNVGATFAASSFLETYPGSLVVLGEGEEAFVGILNAFRQNAPLENIPNLAFKNAQGKITFTKRKRVDLKNVGLPAFDNIKRYVEKNFRIGAETSRGCCYNCHFCNRGEFLAKRAHCAYSAERTLQLITTLSAQGVSGVNFADDDFLQGSLSHLTQIAQGIVDLKKAGLIHSNFQFFFSARVNGIIQRSAILELLKAGGLTGVFLGIESCSEEILARFQKKITFSQTEEAFQILNKLDLIVEAGFIMFDPQMTLTQLEGNVQGIKKLGMARYLSYPFGQLRAQSGSPIIATLDKAGLIQGKLDEEWLVYPYTFQSEAVFSVVNLCKEWEMGSYEVTDCLKDLYRYHRFTNDSTSQASLRISDLLGEMRELYMDFLSSAIDLVKNHPTQVESREKLKRHFCQRRSFLVSMILHDIEKNIIQDTFGVLYKKALLALIKDYNILQPFQKSPLLITAADKLSSSPLTSHTATAEEELLSLFPTKFRGQDFVGSNKNGSILI